jgi:uncharacterized damage-inducible protein DinB
MDFRDWFPILWRERHRGLDACRDLTPEEWRRQHGFASGSLQRLFAHAIECERGWITEDVLREPYERLSDEAIERLFADPAAVRRRSEEVAAITRRALDTFVPARLAEIRSGLDRENQRAEFTVESILLHLVTHELRHQGQVQAMLRLLGKKAPNLDWI